MSPLASGTQPVRVRLTEPLLVASEVLVAVICTLPGSSAVTSPFELTVALLGSLLLQVTPCAAPDGETVTDSCTVAPTSTVLLGDETDTLLTAGGLLLLLPPGEVAV